MDDDAGLERMRAQMRDLALLSRAAVAANEAMSIAAVTDETVAMLAKHVGWPVATAWLRHRRDGVLRSSGSWYDERHPDMAALRDAVDARLLVTPGSVPGQVGRTGAPVWIHDAEAFAALGDGAGWLSGDADRDRHLGIGAAFAVPVWYGREVVGVIGLFHPEPRPRDDAVLELVEQVATQLGCVVGRLGPDPEPTPVVAAMAGATDRRVLVAAVERLWDSLADIAHEVRTPLNGVLGSLELLAGELAADGGRGAGTHELVQAALDAAGRLHALIEQKLAAAEADLAAAVDQAPASAIR